MLMFVYWSIMLDEDWHLKCDCCFLLSGSSFLHEDHCVDTDMCLDLRFKNISLRS